jgi:hypothetical protein
MNRNPWPKLTALPRAAEGRGQRGMQLAMAVAAARSSPSSSFLRDDNQMSARSSSYSTDEKKEEDDEEEEEASTEEEEEASTEEEEEEEVVVQPPVVARSNYNNKKNVVAPASPSSNSNRNAALLTKADDEKKKKTNDKKTAPPTALTMTTTTTTNNSHNNHYNLYAPVVALPPPSATKKTNNGGNNKAAACQCGGEGAKKKRSSSRQRDNEDEDEDDEEDDMERLRQLQPIPGDNNSLLQPCYFVEERLPAVDKHISVSHRIGPFGLLHAMTLHDDCMAKMRKLCHETPCDAVHPNAEALFSDETRALLQQGLDNESIALAKLPDGYLLYVPSRKNQLLSVIKDAFLFKGLADPSAPVKPIAPNNARVVAYSIVLPNHHAANKEEVRRPPPTKKEEEPPAVDRAFHVVFHDGPTEAHQISRFGCADHCVAQVAAALKLSETPRILFQAEGLGTLLGQNLTGTTAHYLKETFLQLVQKGIEARNGVYNMPITVSDTIARLLHFDSSAALGRIALGRLHDGLFAFRIRPDGRNAFLFAATCDEFNAQAPCPLVESSQLQLYRLVYSGHSATDPRFFIHIASRPPSSSSSGGEEEEEASPTMVPGCPLGLPYILPNVDTMQSVLNLLELGMRVADRNARQCGDFTGFCVQEAIRRMRSSEPPSDPLNAYAMCEVLRERPRVPPGRVWAAFVGHKAEEKRPHTPPHRGHRHHHAEEPSSYASYYGSGGAAVGGDGTVNLIHITGGGGGGGGGARLMMYR